MELNNSIKKIIQRFKVFGSLLTRTFKTIRFNLLQIIHFVGQNIRLLRQSKGYTIEKLALDANIESKQLRRIELGEVNTSIYQIYNLANSMGIHISEFLNNIPE